MSEKVKEASSVVADSEDAYKVEMARILLRTVDFTCQPAHLVDCVVGVLVNEVPQMVL